MESGATDETVLNKVLISSKKIHLAVIDMNMEYDQKQKNKSLVTAISNALKY
jgi:hypothetical protein